MSPSFSSPDESVAMQAHGRSDEDVRNGLTNDPQESAWLRQLRQETANSQRMTTASAIRTAAPEAFALPVSSGEPDIVDVSARDVQRVRAMFKEFEGKDPAAMEQIVSSHMSDWTPGERNAAVRAMANGDSINLPSRINGVTRHRIILWMCRWPLDGR